MKPGKTALLISTYNWPKALELLLESIIKQTVMPNELLIADDGSGTATQQLINTYLPRFTIPVHHIWQKDKGFRKAKILNKAIAASESEYIIQVDGDCILHRKFIQDHISTLRHGFYVYGTRVHIKKPYVAKVLKANTTKFYFFSKGIKKRPRSLRIPFLSTLFTPQNTISPKFRGCNTAFWKADIIAVNGYNEDLEGWGMEDSELIIRLHHSGIRGKRLKFKGIVYHLDHPENSKINVSENETIQQKTLVEKHITIKNGIAKYIKNGQGLT